MQILVNAAGQNVKCVAVAGGFSLLLQKIRFYKENVKMALEVKVEQLGASMEAQAACGAGEIEFVLGLLTGGWCWVWERLEAGTRPGREHR